MGLGTGAVPIATDMSSTQSPVRPLWQWQGFTMPRVVNVPEAGLAAWGSRGAKGWNEHEQCSEGMCHRSDSTTAVGERRELHPAHHLGFSRSCGRMRYPAYLPSAGSLRCSSGKPSRPHSGRRPGAAVCRVSVGVRAIPS